MGYSLTSSGGGVGLVDYALVPVWELDVVFFIFAALTVLHAFRAREKLLWVSCLIGGLVCEQACIRGGGTHCHHSGFIDVSLCSSGNSVLFYGPWVYSAVVGARRMCTGGLLSQAMWTGLLTGLICWPYEMQGPLLQMWKWADENGVVMPKSAMGKFQSLANDAERGFVTHPAAFADLSIKAFGFPIHAPFFDMAYGVGIGASMALLPSFPALFHTVVLGPVLSVLYIRLPIFVAGFLETSVLVTDPCIMAITVVLALSTTNNVYRKADLLLVIGPLITQVYWASMIARRPAVLPGDLKCIILSITVGGLWIWGRMGRASVGNELQNGAGKKSKKSN